MPPRRIFRRRASDISLTGSPPSALSKRLPLKGALGCTLASSLPDQSGSLAPTTPSLYRLKVTDACFKRPPSVSYLFCHQLSLQFRFFCSWSGWASRSPLSSFYPFLISFLGAGGSRWFQMVLLSRALLRTALRESSREIFFVPLLSGRPPAWR